MYSLHKPFFLQCVAIVVMTPLFVVLTWHMILAGAYHEVSSNTETKKIIIDTDAGSDDGVAISLAIGVETLQKNVTLIGLTAVSGNTNVDNVGRNLLKILQKADRLDIPIFKGLNRSLLRSPKSDNYYGNDGFGDVPYPDPPNEDIIQPTHAVNYLVSTIRQNPGEISLICIGPLSNIAMAIRLDPNFIDNVAEIIILGGSVHGEGNIRPGIEFNIHMDPDAASIVLQAAVERVKNGGSPIHLVSWETSLASAIDVDWRINVLGAINTPLVNLLNEAESYNFNNSASWVFADSLAVAVALTEVPRIETRQFIVAETCGNFGRATASQLFSPGEENERLIIAEIRALREEIPALKEEETTLKQQEADLFMARRKTSQKVQSAYADQVKKKIF